MNKFSKAIETLKRWIGVEKRSGVEPSKRKKTNKRKSTRRKS